LRTHRTVSKAKLSLADVKYSEDEKLHRKLEAAVQSVDATARRLVLELSEDNKRILVDFLNDMILHDNPRPNTLKVYIMDVVLLARHAGHKKSFKNLKRDDIMAYLQSYRRTDEADPKEAWINTYNRKVISISKFYKWLVLPEMKYDNRKSARADIVADIPLFTRREKTSVQAKDLWTPAEDAVFLKHCPDLRTALYHTMADDTSGRPHEILAKRFGDVKIKNYNGRTYGEVEIGRGGKTKGRTVPLITSIPYFKQWLGLNPGDPNLFIFRAKSPQARFKNKPLNVNILGQIYSRLKEYFKTLLERPDVTPEDKAVIRSMLEKPWNPYIRRHSSLTEKARLLKNDYSLRLHAGWTKNSKMVEIYTHELGGESSNELLAAYGVVPRDVEGKSELLQPKVCPMCSEPNKTDARFCINVKCGMPLSFDAYEETKQKEQQKEDMMAKMMAKIEALEQANKEREELSNGVDKLRSATPIRTGKMPRSPRSHSR
jgi:hypothetical protein